MNLPPVSLILFLVLACCNGPKAETKNGARSAEPADATATKEEPRSAWHISSFGLQSTKHLLPYVTSSSADGGSHEYICEVSQGGEIVRSMLFIVSDNDIGYEFYVVTYPNRTEERSRLSLAEAEHEIKKIETVLAASGAKDRYDYFYAGGKMNEDTVLKERQIAIDSENLEREMAEGLNEGTLFTIARLARSFRRAIDQAEGAPVQPPPAPAQK